MTYAECIYSSDSTAALRAEGVTGTAHGRRVLADVTLEVKTGELFGLIGLNGAGKSTLLKSMVGLLPIDAGSIRIFGCDHRDPGARARLSYLPERFAPSRRLLGGEFLRFLLAVHGQEYAAADAARLLADLELPAAALGQPVAALSKGMAQKLGLAACLLPEKDLYVLDEPASGLDVCARAALKRKLRQLSARGKSVLFTTHSLADVVELCDRMAILDRGCVVYAGGVECLQRGGGPTAAEAAFLSLLGRPEHPFIAACSPPQ